VRVRVGVVVLVLVYDLGDLRGIWDWEWEWDWEWFEVRSASVFISISRGVVLVDLGIFEWYGAFGSDSSGGWLWWLVGGWLVRLEEEEWYLERYPPLSGLYMDIFR
jgi:hypothetical protein